MMKWLNSGQLPSVVNAIGEFAAECNLVSRTSSRESSEDMIVSWDSE